MKQKLKRVLPYLLLVVILGVGAYLRLHEISKYMTFLGDEGRDALVVKRMIVDGKWTLLGPTASVGGFFMGPIYYYFMLPFLWLWNLNPVGPSIMVALFGIATIGLVYLTGSSFFDKQVGLSAAALYALSPLVIAYSRSSWNPNIVPFFSTLLIWLLWKFHQHHKPLVLFWAGVSLGIALQLHYTVLFLCGVVLVWLLAIGRYRKNLLSYFCGIVGFLIGFSPFLVFEIRHGFTNSRSILAFIFEGKDTGFSAAHFISNVTDVGLRLFSRLILRIPDQGMLVNLPVVTKNLWIHGSEVLAISCLLVLFGMFAVAWKKRLESEQRFSTLLLLVIWLVVPLVFFGMYKKGIYDYYFTIFFALPFLLTSLLIRKLEFSFAGKIIAGALLAFLLIFNWEGRPFKYPPNNQLGQMETIASAVISKTDNKPFNFALITGGNSDHAYRYFFEIWGKSPVTIENEQNDPERKTVTDQLLVVCEDPACKPLGNSLWEVAGFGRAEIAGSWDVPFVKIYKLVHYQGETQ